MIYSSNSQRTNFIQSLSRMWRTVFSQSDQLQTAYKAGEQVVAQAYMDLLQDMLGSSIHKQRLFRRLLFRYHVLEDSTCFIVPGFTNQETRYLFPVEIEDKGWKVNSIRYIGNSLIAPTVFQESGVDFDILVDGSVEFQQYKGRNPNLPNQDYIAFKSDPFTTQGFAIKRKEETFYNIVSPIGAAVDYSALGVTTSHSVRITFDADGRQFTLPISSVAVSQLGFDAAYLGVMDADPERLKNRGYTFEVLDNDGTVSVSAARGRFLSQTLQVRGVAVWFSDLLVDDYALAEVYGAFIGPQETSTESYRNLLRGLLQYYVKGNSLTRTTSAVHVIAGLPVIDSDGETVEEITTGVPSTTILTSQNPYYTDADFPLSDTILKTAGKIDGNTPDDTARWLVFPTEVDLLKLGVSGSDSVLISKGNGAAVYVAPILKVYNNRRLLLQAGSEVPNGAGTYWGFSIGSNNPDYDNKFGTRTDIPLVVENFSRDTSTQLKALDPITDAVKVVDFLSEPQWYEGTLTPRELLEDGDVVRRTASERYTAVKIGTPGLKIGDPHFVIGRDENGRAAPQLGVILQIPYFSMSIPNGEEFRRGELVQSIMGVGNGEGVVLYHDKVAQVLYLRVERGKFFSTDFIQGGSSRATAYTGARVEVVVASTAGIVKSQFTSNASSGRVVEILPELNTLELFEHGAVSMLQPGDTITVNGVSTVVKRVGELPYANAMRSVSAYLMDRLWKYSTIKISYDATSFRFPRGLENLREMVVSGAEDRVFVHIEPYARFIDTVPIPTESIALNESIVPTDTLIGFNTQIKIGGPGPGGAQYWQIGDAGYVIGGANPAYDSSNVETHAGGAAVADLAVTINVIV